VAHHKDAKKRIKQIEKRSARNKSIRTFYRNHIKEVRAAVEAGDRDAALAKFKKAASAIDGAVAKNVLHQKTAARYKSRLSKAVAAIGS